MHAEEGVTNSIIEQCSKRDDTGAKQTGKMLPETDCNKYSERWLRCVRRWVRSLTMCVVLGDTEHNTTVTEFRPREGSE